jgi:hypothetical protein
MTPLFALVAQGSWQAGRLDRTGQKIDVYRDVGAPELRHYDRTTLTQ